MFGRVWGVLGVFCRLPVRCEKLGEGLGEFGTRNSAVLVDEESGEEALVDLPLDEVWGGFVVPVAVARHDEGVFQCLFDVSQSGVGGFDLSFSVSHGPGEALHFCFQQVQGHGVGVVCLYEPGAFVLEMSEPFVVSLGVLMGLGDLSSHVGMHAEAGSRSGLFGELSPDPRAELMEWVGLRTRVLSDWDDGSCLGICRRG